MKRIFSLLLAIIMVLGLLSGCDRSPEDYLSQEEVMMGTTGETEPVSLIPPLDEDADVLTFRYEEQYLDLYYEKLEQYKEHALNDSTMDELEALDSQLEELLTYLQDQQTIAMVLYYCDMEDDDASDLHLEMTDMITEVQEKTIETLRDIYNSNSKLKDQIFENYSEDEIQAMLDYDEEVKEIEQRYQEIVVEFQGMDDDEIQDDIGELYAEMVSNYNRLAQIYGYDNYYDYAYERVNARDYTGEEIALMREYGKKYLLPAFKEAALTFQANYSQLSKKDRDRLVDFISEDYDDVDYLDEYFERLPEDVREDMESMFDGNVVFPKSKDAMPGAFTTLINYQPFCFFAKDNRDTSTIVHEMGHYYGALYGDLDMMPLDLAEVQSQANEWLMIAAMEDELESDVYQCYVDYRFTNDIAMILIGLIIDEFEERVYNAEGVENFTTEDFDRIMEEVCEDYGGINYVCVNLTDVQYYWRRVALEHPIYYISYAVSLIPSLDMFFVADEDWEEGLEIYLDLTRDIEEEPEFLESIENAGLAGPFDTDVYEAFAQRYSLALDEG